MKDWIEVELCCVLIQSKEKHKPTVEENLFYIGLEHIEKNQGKLTDQNRVESINTIKNKFKEGQILYGKLRPYLNKVYLAKEAGVCSTDIIVFQPSEKVLPKFAHLFMSSRKFVNQMSENTSGVNLPRVSTSYINAYPFPLPPLPEQRAIVSRIEELFSELDHSISNLKCAQAKLKIYRQAVLKKAFEGNLESEIKESIPVKIVELKEIVEKISDGPFGSNLKTADYTEEGVRVIRLENIGFNEFRDEYQTFISDEKYETIKNHTVKGGDIIFSSFISEKIRAVILPNKIRKAVNKADCFLVRVNESIVRKKYVSYYFSTKAMYSQLVDQVHGATRPRINTSQLKISKIPLAKLSHQDNVVQEIESRLSVADKLAETIETNLKKSESLRQSILKKALEGKLLSEAELEACRKEADWEPAEKLLERIKVEKKK